MNNSWMTEEGTKKDGPEGGPAEEVCSAEHPSTKEAELEPGRNSSND